MFIDSLESHHTEDIEPVKMLVKQKAKQVPEVESSPTTIFAPMSAPPAMKLPEALPEPRLPRASVWLHSEKGTWPALLVPLIPRGALLPALGIPTAWYSGRIGRAVRDMGRSMHPRWAAAAVVRKPLTLRLLMQVWGSASPMLKRVWSSSREHEVMEEWLDEVELPNNAKMVLKGASAWPEKDREYKTKHAREP